MVDVTHDRDDRRTRSRRAFVVGTIEEALLHVGFGDTLDGVAEFLGNQLRGVGVESVGQGHHTTLAHQKLDHVDGALRHAARQLLDRDGFRQDDFACDLFFLVVRSMALEPLRASAE